MQFTPWLRWSALVLVVVAEFTRPDAAWAQMVRLVYVVPTDREPREEYRAAIEMAGQDLQWFYQSQMGDGRTFTLDPAGVLVLRSTRTASWYGTNAPAGFSTFYSNVRADVEALTGRPAGSLHDGPDVWVLYADAHPVCGQCGGCGGSRVLVVGRNDLRGLVGEQFEPVCPTDFDRNARCRWIGGRTFFRTRSSWCHEART
jgi:hypothetical protein